MQPGTLVAGKYRVERVIGRGGMGLVVEATHVQLETRVAVKFLAEELAGNQTAIARFTREARASAQLRGEHVCRVTDFGVEGTTFYLVMELLQGTDLARLSKLRTLDVATAALYIQHACAGLAEAHAANIVHRDLKPGNLFLTRRADGSPLVKVLDFGVAKASIGDRDEKLTATASVLGSPGFMSPEQFRSSKTADGRSDVWSLGVILYKLVSGRLPFKADSYAEFALAISRDPMPPLPEAPAAFEAVVARCLEKDPAARYQDVGALAEALAPFAAQARTSAPRLDAEPAAGSSADTKTPAESATSAFVPAPATEVRPPQRTLMGTVEARAPAPPTRPPAVAGSSGPGATAPEPSAMEDANAWAASPAQSLGVPAPANATIHGAPASASETARGTAFPSRETAQGTAFPAHDTPPGQTARGIGAAVRGGSAELASGAIVGEYRIEGKIGEGGMGVVYGAVHPLIGKRAAIKVISAELGTDPVVVQRFVQEARTVNQIGHPNIVDVFAFGKLPDGRNYFVMEYLHGESLRARLTRAFMSLGETVQILDEVASALEAAHDKQIVHRDLKPDNVYLASVRGGYLIVKLLDFGIAKLAANETGIAKTSTGELIGTPLYLSPEQARGKQVDHRTDIYALGVMMYEMVTGRLPFLSDSAMEIVYMHVSKAPRRPSDLKPDIPAQLEQLIVQMLDKDPARRPSLGHVRDVFAELVASGLVQVEPGSGATFRSELARGAASLRAGGSRTPNARRAGESTPPPGMAGPITPGPLTPSQPIVADGAALGTIGRRRAHPPSDAPTEVAFTPGPDTLTPADRSSPESVAPAQTGAALSARRRRRFAVAIVIAALCVPVASIVVGVVRGGGGAAPRDAASAPLGAGSSAEDLGARGAVAVRQIEIRVIDAPGAAIAIDGADVAARGGVASVSLPDGPHRIAVRAPGRELVERAVEVGQASERVIEIRLPRTPAGRDTRAGAGGPRTNGGARAGTGSEGAADGGPRTGQGANSGGPRPDAGVTRPGPDDKTIDPFAPEMR